MDKNFLKVFIVISIALLNVLNIKALEIDGEKYNIEIINDKFTNRILSYGFKLISKINEETSDLDKGEINVELTLDNNVEEEVVFVIDNIENLNKSSYNKNKIIEDIKDAILVKKENNNAKHGMVVTTSGNNFITTNITDSNIDNEVENFNNIDYGNDGDVFNALDYASNMFSNNETTNKMLILIIYSLGNEDKEVLKRKIETLSSKDIIIKVVAPNYLDNEEDYEYIFGNDINTHLYYYFEEIQYSWELFDLSFNLDENVANNFNITNIKIENKNLNYNEENKMVSSYNNEHELYNEKYYIKKGEKLTLTYTLTLKENFDKKIVNQDLETNFNNYIDVCIFRENGISLLSAPACNIRTIKGGAPFKIVKEEVPIINEPIENPKTGIESYVVFGICLMVVSGVTYLIINKRKVL